MSATAGTTEAFSWVVIDDLLKDVGWNLTDGHSVRYEYQLPDGSRADHVLCDRHGRALAVIEAKRSAINPADAAAQGRAYAEQLKVPYVFLANAREILFWECDREAYPRPVRTFFSQEDLARRAATRQVKVEPLTVAIDKNIAGRDYQTECIDTLCREMQQGRRKLLVEMATGAGKTRMAAALVKRLFQANAITRVLFLVDRVTLAKQTEDAFVEHLRDYPCYVLRAGRRFQDEKRITITTLQSMIGIYRDYSAGYFDLVITDECHRSIYGKWSGILKYFDGIQVGLTATPFALKNRDDLPDEEDKLFVRDTLRFFEVEEPTFRYSLKQAISDGYLVPYQIYKAKTVKTAAESGFEVKRGEMDWSAMDDATKQELEKLFGNNETMMVDPAALERKFTIPERNRAMVREFREVMRNGFRDERGYTHKPLIGKTIVFAVTKRHAETLARMFDEAFAAEKPDPSVRYADYVVSDMGRDDTADGGTRIKRFKKEKYPQIMVSVNMLDTGFDYPEVVNLVMARFTKSVVLYRQMRGRGTRKAPGKASFTLFDFVGVVDFHGDDDTAMGGFVAEPKKKGPSQPRKLLTLDVDDHIDPATRGWVTVDENGNFTFLEPSQERAGQLGARFEAWLLGQSGISAEQRRWLQKVGAQIRANAEAWQEFSVDRLVMPPFSLYGGLKEAIRIFSSEKQLQAVIASLNAAVFDEGRKPPRDEARPSFH